MTQEQFYLTLISEECNEIAQRASKAIRFGMQEVQEGQELDNASRLIYEFNDLLAVMEMVFNTKIDTMILRGYIEQKKQKVDKWAKYSKELGQI